MKYLKIIFILYIFIIQSCLKTLCAESANQSLNASLPQVLSIEKIIVEAQEYDRDERMSNMEIKETRNVDQNSTVLRLSPVRVQIHTNMGTPIIVYAKFRDLKHKAGMFDFTQANLAIMPESYTINNPYDHVISGIFTPFANVTPDTVAGDYRGTLTFTLGAI